MSPRTWDMVHEDMVCRRVSDLKWPAHSPDLNTTEHPWDELKCYMLTRPSHLPLSLDLTKVLVAECAQILTSMFQNLVKSFTRIQMAVIAAKGGGKMWGFLGFISVLWFLQKHVCA